MAALSRISDLRRAGFSRTTIAAILGISSAEVQAAAVNPSTPDPAGGGVSWTVTEIADQTIDDSDDVLLAEVDLDEPTLVVLDGEFRGEMTVYAVEPVKFPGPLGVGAIYGVTSVSRPGATWFGFGPSNAVLEGVPNTPFVLPAGAIELRCLGGVDGVEIRDVALRVLA